jgi:hypothetical protein
VDSSRVRWVPLLRSFRKLGAFTFSPHPGVLSFPECRLLCPIHLSPQASGFALGSRCPPSTSLRILAKVSRVHHVGLRRGAVGGALLTAPSALCGSPVPAWDKQVPPCALLRRELSAPHRVLLAPCDFRLDWLTSQLRYVRVPFSRRAMRTSSDSPWHFLAKHHVLETYFLFMMSFSNRLFTS